VPLVSTVLLSTSHERRLHPYTLEQKNLNKSFFRADEALDSEEDTSLSYASFSSLCHIPNFERKASTHSS
jgi:hypothetical protein